MRVYVVGSSAELERAEEAIASLRSRGAVITHDWTADVRRAQAAGCTDGDLSDEEAQAFALADVEAVAAADAVLFLAPGTPTRGAWVELGFALARGKHVVVSGPACRASIFTRAAAELVLFDLLGVERVMARRNVR